MPDPRCSVLHPDGRHGCILLTGHAGPHMAFHIERIEWALEPPAPRAHVARHPVTRTPPGSEPTERPTGDLCLVCGSARLVRTGSCLTCLDCGEGGSCG